MLKAVARYNHTKQAGDRATVERHGSGHDRDDDSQHDCSSNNDNNNNINAAAAAAATDDEVSAFLGSSRIVARYLAFAFKSRSRLSPISPRQL